MYLYPTASDEAFVFGWELASPTEYNSKYPPPKEAGDLLVG